MSKLQRTEALVWIRMEKFSCLAKAVPNDFDRSKHETLEGDGMALEI